MIASTQSQLSDLTSLTCTRLARKCMRHSAPTQHILPLPSLRLLSYHSPRLGISQAPIVLTHLLIPPTESECHKNSNTPAARLPLLLTCQEHLVGLVNRLIDPLHLHPLPLRQIFPEVIGVLLGILAEMM